MLLIGIDCATVESKVGLALAEYGDGSISVKDVCTGATKCPPATVICSWLEDVTGPALLAFDSPLGWPEAMGRHLAMHKAGAVMEVEPNLMFRRETDRFIHQQLGKTPLDVGADRIARTALATLRLLGDLRLRLRETIPLAWSPTINTRLSAIEVYPAATLLAHGLQSTRYKNVSQANALAEIAGALALEARIDGLDRRPLNNSDELDAVVCIVAAKDFIEGRSAPPVNQLLAEREGWIWAARPNLGGKSAS